MYPCQSTKSRLLDSYQRYRSTRDLLRSGRSRVITAAQERYIRVRHLRDRFTTATSISSSILGRHRVFDQTVWIRLREAGRNARRPVRGVSLNQRHCQNRLHSSTVQLA